ncbi:MAG: hypothetical protein H6644_22970 [Caldilineaceae bacterium]|nr:hypothetical protein [Caldilineaceae bacterium]
MTRGVLPLILLILTLALPPAPRAAQPGVTCDVAHVTIADAPLHTPRPCRDPIRLNGRMLVLTDLLAVAEAPSFEQCVLMQGVAGRQTHTERRFVLTGAAKLDGVVTCDLLRDPPVCEIAATGDFRLLDLDTKDAHPVTLHLNTIVTGSDVDRQTFRFVTDVDLCPVP